MTGDYRICLNCEEPLQGKYCSSCGQENIPENVHLKTVFSDVIDDYFTIDSKIITSLVPLLFRPGFLSLEYFAGRRVRYVKPFRIYILSSLLFFFLFFMNQGSFVDSTDAELPPNVLTQPDSLVTAMDLDSTISSNSFNFTIDDEADADSTELSAFERFLVKRTERFEDMDDEEMDAGFSSFFRNNIPKVMFVLLPVFAGLLKLFFRKKRPYYLEHFIFSLHLHSFCFVGFSLSILLSLLTGTNGTESSLKSIWGIVHIPLGDCLYDFLPLKMYTGKNGEVLSLKPWFWSCCILLQ